MCMTFQMLLYFITVLLHGCYIDLALANAGHFSACIDTGDVCAPTFHLGGTLPSTSSPNSSRDVAGVEAALLKVRTTAALDCSKRWPKAESD